MHGPPWTLTRSGAEAGVEGSSNTAPSIHSIEEEEEVEAEVEEEDEDEEEEEEEEEEEDKENDDGRQRTARHTADDRSAPEEGKLGQ